MVTSSEAAVLSHGLSRLEPWLVRRRDAASVVRRAFESQLQAGALC